jgi:hypothetical protein
MPRLCQKSDRNEWRSADVGEDACTKAESGLCFATRLEYIRNAWRN